MKLRVLAGALALGLGASALAPVAATADDRDRGWRDGRSGGRVRITRSYRDDRRGDRARSYRSDSYRSYGSNRYYRPYRYNNYSYRYAYPSYGYAYGYRYYQQTEPRKPRITTPNKR